MFVSPCPAEIRLGSYQPTRPYKQGRLSEYERSRFIKSGSVFVWDEDETAMKRWTDGRQWCVSIVPLWTRFIPELSSSTLDIYCGVGLHLESMAPSWFITKYKLDSHIPPNQKRVLKRVD